MPLLPDRLVGDLENPDQSAERVGRFMLDGGEIAGEGAGVNTEAGGSACEGISACQTWPIFGILRGTDSRLR